ncbi:BLUF domain-containing protein [Epibacterium ulvae]|uniref:BLUF domain-containing protein n=1 Tax=Epibacterium ulvae TaxID=1156985 RepID=UPI001BFC6D03|nr:BLUF domain-containing protein [Epibacterium ulvae]MBT8155937.1 BLUF domain-containing protein [Epibacterium ulvae]
MFFRLLYRAKANYPPFTFHDLEILRTAFARNPKLGITGFLLRGETEYFQILEGPRGQVETLADSIRADGRVYCYIPIWSGPVDVRLFGPWTMGFHVFDNHGDGLLQRLSRLTDDTPTSFKQQAIRDVAQLALDEHKRAANGSP